ncbi:MAG: flagellar motor switch protein FliM [Melioribacteraceae bacterium]|nr:flagellar motor switch protein FliM [Melioribacteraceae bacterium]MCF8355138.1 flagellar motor switch protein FliM [Melioribacteraceae bacterium]MCF8392467.1 flagellar motor switch protein FliM [Melioribacteraceae bacterium]MCF8418378.1 flagellar motor switch protein FliM [Melioribacteraceae bacterium]
MAEVLSQNEIDQLLNDVKSGSEHKEKSEVHRDVIPYDFRLPNRISKIQLRTLQNIHENFSESFSSFLMTKLQSIVNINVISVDQIYYSEYVLSVSNPACLYKFEVTDTDIKGILELSPELAILFVDRLLGGTGDNVKHSNLITAIEQKVLTVIIERIFQDLRKSWTIIGDYHFKLDRFEPDIDFAQITSQSESVLLISFEVKLGEESYMMNLCFATYAFDSVLAKLNNQNFSTIRPIKYKGTTARNILVRNLHKTELAVSVKFGSAKVSIKDLVGLQKGDVVILQTKVGSEMEVYTNDKLVFFGMPGNVNNHKAVKITRKLENKEEL